MKSMQNRVIAMAAMQFLSQEMVWHDARHARPERPSQVMTKHDEERIRNAAEKRQIRKIKRLRAK
jgi:hypothetical protein